MEVSRPKQSNLTALLTDAPSPNGIKLKPRRTQYAVTPDKYNLIEVQRKVNKMKMNSPRVPDHLEELHKLEEKRQQTREKLVRQKTDESDKVTYSFKPQINDKSEKLMNSKVELIQRNWDWLKQKEEKVKFRQEEKEKVEAERDYQSMVARPEFPRSKIDVASKVRQLLEMSALKHKGTASGHIDRSMSPITPRVNNKAYNSYILNTGWLNRYK